MLKWESLRAETITGHSQYAAAAHFPPYAPSPAGPAHSGRRKGKSAFLRPFPFCHAGAGRRSRAARQIFRFAPGRQKSEGCKAPSLLMMLFFSSAPFPAAAEAWGAIAGAQMPGLF